MATATTTRSRAPSQATARSGTRARGGAQAQPQARRVNAATVPVDKWALTTAAECAALLGHPDASGVMLEKLARLIARKARQAAARGTLARRDE